MFCHNCGKEIPEGAQFCTNCGTPVGGTSPAENSAATPVSATTAPAAAGKKSKMNMIGIIAGAVVALATFLPFVSVSVFGTSISQSLMDGGDGIIYLIVAAVAIVCAALGFNIVVIITGMISLILFFIENSSLKDVTSDSYLGELASSLIQKGAGYYLILIGSIALIVAGVMGIMQKKRKNSN